MEVCSDYSLSIGSWQIHPATTGAAHIFYPTTLSRGANAPRAFFCVYTDYQKADMDPDVWEEFFAGKNWDYFLPEEQIVFRNHTAYIAIY